MIPDTVEMSIMDTKFQLLIYTEFKEEDKDNLYYLGLIFMVGWIFTIAIGIISSIFFSFTLRNIGQAGLFLIFAHLIIIIIQKYSTRKYISKYVGKLSVQHSSLFINETCISIDNVKHFDIHISSYLNEELNSFISYISYHFFFDIDLIKANKSNGINGNIIRILTFDETQYEFNFLIDSKKSWGEFRTKIILLFELNLLHKKRAFKLLKDHYGYTYSDSNSIASSSAEN